MNPGTWNPRSYCRYGPFHPPDPTPLPFPTSRLASVTQLTSVLRPSVRLVPSATRGDRREPRVRRKETVRRTEVRGANRGRWVTVRPQPKDRKIEILLPLVYLRLFTLLLILSSLRLVRYASEPTEEVRRSSETRRG